MPYRETNLKVRQPLPETAVFLDHQDKLAGFDGRCILACSSVVIGKRKESYLAPNKLFWLLAALRELTKLLRVSVSGLRLTEATVVTFDPLSRR